MGICLPGGTATKHWIGDQEEDLVRAGWFAGNAGGRTHAAGELMANPFGLSDIHGNVWEWVQDGWDATYYGQFPDKPAINPTVPFSASSQRVFRGGDWNCAASHCRSSNRDAAVPSRRIYSVWFRVSLSVDAVIAAISSSNTISSATTTAKSKRRFASDEWIDVIPLIDPQADKWHIPQRTGKNAWRIERGELVVGGDALASKLLLPLDSDWRAFECEVEFTRRAGDSGFNVNLPTKVGECPLLFDPTANGGVFLGSRLKGPRLQAEPAIVTGKRSTMRVNVRRQQDADQMSVAFNGAAIGEWTGDRTAISYSYREGFPHDRRLSLWIHPGGNEFVFHRIRVRMVDGGTAESLRPVSSAAPSTSTPLAIAPFDAAQARAHQEAWAKHLSVPVDYTNSIGMKFRLIPPGEFMMGSSPAEIAEAMIAAGNDDNWKTHLKSEEPQHKVVLTQPFYLGVYEVTQDEYARITGKNPSYFAEVGTGKDRVAGLQTSRFPVEQVTWSDATAFAKKLGQSELGKADAYYLPTEAEWEFACRAGTQTKYGFGDTDGFLSEHGRHGTSRTHAVGELKPNAFQLHDIHGNVWEWVHDLWDSHYYSGFANVAAQNPRGPQAPHDRHVTRGGCWANPPSSCRSAHRISEPEGTWGFLLGFRLALSVEAVKASKPPAPSASAAPFTDADVRRVAALPTAEQVEEVRKELKKRNPSFDGTLLPTIENDVVTRLEFFTQHVTDISPVRALQHLTSLNCRADGGTAGMVSD